MSFQWKMEKTSARLYAGDALICMIPARENCCDSLEEIGEGAWKWVRKTAAPVTEMKMTLQSAAPLTYWQVPSVNYNGNGWGSGAQYSGFGCDGTPWTYAWHRVAVPACTYSEQGPWGVSLFGEEKGGMSCSIWEEDGCARQALLWPEVEGPKCSPSAVGWSPSREAWSLPIPLPVSFMYALWKRRARDMGKCWILPGSCLSGR
ncbi:MAG: hypothetical protein IJP04_07385 [Clostridia bacterium]|nr:hypothetical protein [Clostridia bacterium]